MATKQSISPRLVASLDQAWAAIRARHPEVPEIVIALASGTATKRAKLGHFAPERWQHGEDRLPEMLIAGEGLKRGARDVLCTLLHEAAHGIANTRGIVDTSRQGRYHNTKYRDIAREVGLTVERDNGFGWTDTTVPDETAKMYADELGELGAAIVAWRHAEMHGNGGRKSNNNGHSARCECGRKIRVSPTVFEVGPITCGACGAPFEIEDDA